MAVPMAGGLVGHSALALADLVRSGEVSARQVVQAHLDRIDRVNGAVNAVTRVLAEEALAAADRLGPTAVAPLPPVGYDLGGPDNIGRLWHSLRLVVAVNALGLPAVAVPVGRDQQDRLPLGVQLVAGRFQEPLALAAASDLQSAYPPLTPIPDSGPASPHLEHPDPMAASDDDPHQPSSS
jgi:Asp-tRNA(Asn)/Glu-tRNA(Gln) amidotransferase A subunit family amidase